MRSAFLLLIALCGLMESACTSTRTLTPPEREMVFTVDTLRRGGVLVPVPFEQRHVTERRSRTAGGAMRYSHTFDPPQALGFPVFLRSEAAIYSVPGHAFYASTVLGVTLTLSGFGAGESIDLTGEFPNLADEASLFVFRHPDGQIGAFILKARRDNRTFSVALAGPPAYNPEAWFGFARRCLKNLADFDPAAPARSSFRNRVLDPAAPPAASPAAGPNQPEPASNAEPPEPAPDVGPPSDGDGTRQRDARPAGPARGTPVPANLFSRHPPSHARE